MKRYVPRVFGLAGVLVLVAGCGASGHSGTVRLLDDRMQARLAGDIAADQATFQALPDGARVTLLGSSLFPTGSKTLADHHPDVRADVIEALLDPSLMRVEVTDTGASSAEQREERIRNVSQYFVENGLGSTLVEAGSEAQPGPGGAGPVGLTITITVQCPGSHGGWGYGDGKSNPTCD